MCAEGIEPGSKEARLPATWYRRQQEVAIEGGPRRFRNPKPSAPSRSQLSRRPQGAAGQGAAGGAVRNEYRQIHETKAAPIRPRRPRPLYNHASPSGWTAQSCSAHCAELLRRDQVLYDTVQSVRAGHGHIMHEALPASVDTCARASRCSMLHECRLRFPVEEC